MNDAIAFIEDCESGLGIVLRVTQGLRTFAQQEALYEQGRENLGHIVTNAKPGQSGHNYGISIDLVQMINGVANWNYDMARLLPYAEKYNIEWGGNWKTITDKPHWQNFYGYTWQQLLEKYNAKDFIPNTTYVNL
jgi:hypothetical protein